MKEVKAFIRPEMLNRVYDGLKSSGYCCITVTEGEGTGKYDDPANSYPTLQHPFLHSKVVKIEIVCHEEDVEFIAGIISKNGSTGRKGDGLMYVENVEQVFRVRDGSAGDDILDCVKKED
jgi:nitrogen regulatory protein P-II 1